MRPARNYHLIFILLAVLLGIIRWWFPERPLEVAGLHAWLDTGFAIGLLAGTLLLAAASGRRVLRWLDANDLSLLERVLFGTCLGLGLLAYSILTLGLAGALRPLPVLFCLVVLTWFAWPELDGTFERLVGMVRGVPKIWKEITLGGKALAGAGVALLIMSSIQALAPPSDYDGLMYHLEAPKLFLKAGRIYLLPDLWQANGPFTVEMLFTMGLAFGSDTYAKLIHMAYALGLVLATFAFGKRYLGISKSFAAVAILLGSPIFPYWASLANVDMAWALFSFLGFYALAIWRERGGARSLVLAGLMVGLALGTKYLALGWGGILGAWVLWQSRRANLKAGLTHGLLFGSTALLLGMPWYLKNWLWSGNPLYPLAFGGLDWPAARLELLMVYLRSFGTGRTIWDYLRLPLSIYTENARFSTLQGLELPGFLFPLALFYPFFRKAPRISASPEALQPSPAMGRIMDALAVTTALGFVLWALASQQTRFLLPLYPGLSLLAAHVLFSLCGSSRLRLFGRPLFAGLAGGQAAATVFFQILLFVQFAPLPVLTGFQSKDDYLQRNLNNYLGLSFIQSELKGQGQIMMMWDGRGYYCGERCLLDGDQSRWTRLVARTDTPEALAAELRKLNVTHLFFSLGDTLFFLDHDPAKQHQKSIDYFNQVFAPRCTEEVYRDAKISIYALSCGGAAH